LPTSELATGLMSESLHHVVHPSPPHAETLNDSQPIAQTGEGEDLPSIFCSPRVIGRSRPHARQIHISRTVLPLTTVPGIAESSARHEPADTLASRPCPTPFERICRQVFRDGRSAAFVQRPDRIAAGLAGRAHDGLIELADYTRDHALTGGAQATAEIPMA
jgi:hypothetical protein